MSAVFLSRERAERAALEFGTPLYIYSEHELRAYAKRVLAAPAPFGLTVRYAMKALPTKLILQIFFGMGIQIDASSGQEAERAMRAGIPGARILLTAQELPENLWDLLAKGVQFTACSPHQLRTFGERFPGEELSVRINPGEGLGSHPKVTVAGEHAGFGVWHEEIPAVLELVKRHGLKVVRVHTHVGSGTDPDAWGLVVERSVRLLEFFPEAKILNVGGGFKVARVEGEKEADFEKIGQKMSDVLVAFEARTGRRIHLELEPGTFLTANAGVLLARIQDIARTPEHVFYKLDAGMTELLRPALYAAQHPMGIFSDTSEQESAVVIGHCCESADLFTPDPLRPAQPLPRSLPKAKIGDLLWIGGAGAYSSAMSAIGYNSFPQAPELLLQEKGEIRPIRARQSLEQLVQNEL